MLRQILSKSPLAVLLLLLILGPAVFSHARDRTAGPANRPGGPCLTSIKYRVGRLDPRFGISRETFQRDVEEAGKLWEAAADRKLFDYAEKGWLKIDFVYDSRQETTQRFVTLRARISEELKAADAIKDKLLPLQSKFDTLDSSYTARLLAYEEHLKDFNTTAAQWNGMGGAPEGVYQQSSSERQSLRSQAASLEQSKQALNRLSDEINALVNQHNALLRRANAEADTLNEAASSALEFEEGRYLKQGGEERIEIFQYEGETGLRLILAHELGHALGIGHNSNPSSVISPLIHTDQLALTAEDRGGLRIACSLH